MVVRKILEATLVAGSTSITFTDTDIPNSLLRVYCTRSGLFPISQTLSGNSVTVNYKPQDSNVGVALEIVKSGLDIVDDLTTEDNTKALSANQGYILKGLIDGIVIPTVPENITDLDDVDVIDITNGQVLAWNSTSEKFENVNQSGGSSSYEYSTDEIEIGTWIDNKKLYRKVITGLSVSLNGTKWVNYNPNINIDKLINVHAYYSPSSNTMLSCALAEYQYSSGYGIQMSTTSSTFNRTINILIIEYTKTS